MIIQCDTRQKKKTSHVKRKIIFKSQGHELQTFWNGCWRLPNFRKRKYCCRHQERYCGTLWKFGTRPR